MRPGTTLPPAAGALIEQPPSFDELDPPDELDVVPAPALLEVPAPVLPLLVEPSQVAPPMASLVAPQASGHVAPLVVVAAHSRGPHSTWRCITGVKVWP